MPAGGCDDIIEVVIIFVVEIDSPVLNLLACHPTMKMMECYTHDTIDQKKSEITSLQCRTKPKASICLL